MSAPTAAVRERPILFSAPMVRALLAGTKTQTRRVMKPQPPEWINKFGYTCFTPPGHISGRGYWQGVPGEESPAEKFFRSPYGVRGDRLWVRESIRFVGATPMGDLSEYIADGTLTEADGWPWKRNVLPCIHCPRGLSRTTLEITGVRVERVQDITEGDARAEGVERDAWPDDRTEDDVALNEECGYFPPLSHAAGFARLWDAINAKRGHGWDLNPWVWVVEFRAVTP